MHSVSPRLRCRAGYRKGREAKAVPLLHQRRKVAELFIAKSKFKLRINPHPLLCLDFDREMHTAPGSHGNVHAERGAITGMLARNNPDSGELSRLHLPVGGARMRSCLEDLRQLLVEEFRVDSMPNALQAIEDGRVTWRRRQLAAMVRDDPEEAARVLEDKLDYEGSRPPLVPVASGSTGCAAESLLVNGHAAC